MYLVDNYCTAKSFERNDAPPPLKLAMKTSWFLANPERGDPPNNNNPKQPPQM